MNRKKIFSVLIALLLIASIVPLAAAQSDQPAMKATPAYNGYFKYGEWLPVWVELENQGRDIEDAEVRIQINAAQGVIVFAAPVSLPAGSRKRLPVYVLPNNFSRELDVRLVSDDEVLVSQKATIRPQPNISYFAGILAPERGALALLSGVKLPGQERPKILADITLAEIPDRAEALNSFDLLVLNDVDTSQITPEQAAALSGWVSQGGRLVIGGGANAQRTLAGLPETLLPMAVEGVGEVGQDALDPLIKFAGAEDNAAQGPFVIARGTLAQGAEVLAGTEEQPLVVERAMGAGQVDFVAFDLAGVPFNGWPGTTKFWETLAGPGAAYPENMPFDVSPRQFRANSLTYPLSNIPSLDLPSVQGISILLGVYIIFVGPLNYLFLRWRKRMHWAWITIPALTAVFSLAAFGIGYAMRGNDLMLNKIALIETNRDGSAAVTSYMGLFSPRQQSYAVDVEGEGLISPLMGYDGGPWGGMPATGSEMVFYQGQPAHVEGLTVNQWAMQSFVFEGSMPNFGSLTGDLRIENETLLGVVRNESQYALTDVVVTVQNRFARLGDLAPGAEAEVNLGLSNLQSDRFGAPLSYRLYMERFDGTMPNRENELKSNIVSTLFENSPWGKPLMIDSRMVGGAATDSPFQQEVRVFGWLKQAPPEVSVPDNRLSQQTTALVYSYLDYKLPDTGVLSLPPGMIPGTVSKVPVQGGICGPNGTPSVHMGAGEAEFQFRVPTAAMQGYQVDTLKLALWRDTGNQWGMPDVSIYNWTDETWTTIQEPIQGTNVIQKAAPYVDTNGTVWVKIASETDTFGCIYLDLGIEAQRAGQGG